MVTVKPDDRRHITPTREIAEMADEFELVKVRDEILLVPIPEDPLKALTEQGKKLPKDTTIRAMRQKARERALREAREHAIR